MKHLLKLLDLSSEEIVSILDLADQLKYEKKNNIPHRLLEGKSLGMIFQKSSTRTRVSFETGMYQLGGQALFLSSRDLQIGRGEPVQDTARVLSRYLDGIMIRTFAQKEVEDLAEYGSIPIINGLTDISHPCQVLADLLTTTSQGSSRMPSRLSSSAMAVMPRPAHPAPAWGPPASTQETPNAPGKTSCSRARSSSDLPRVSSTVGIRPDVRQRVESALGSQPM